MLRSIFEARQTDKIDRRICLEATVLRGLHTSACLYLAIKNAGCRHTQACLISENRLQGAID